MPPSTWASVPAKTSTIAAERQNTVSFSDETAPSRDRRAFLMARSWLEADRADPFHEIPLGSSGQGGVPAEFEKDGLVPPVEDPGDDPAVTRGVTFFGGARDLLPLTFCKPPRQTLVYLRVGECKRISNHKIAVL